MNLPPALNYFLSAAFLCFGIAAWFAGGRDTTRYRVGWKVVAALCWMLAYAYATGGIP